MKKKLPMREFRARLAVEREGVGMGKVMFPHGDDMRQPGRARRSATAAIAIQRHVALSRDCGGRWNAHPTIWDGKIK